MTPSKSVMDDPADGISPVLTVRFDPTAQLKHETKWEIPTKSRVSELVSSRVRKIQGAVRPPLHGDHENGHVVQIVDDADDR